MITVDKLNKDSELEENRNTINRKKEAYAFFCEKIFSEPGILDEYSTEIIADVLKKLEESDEPLFYNEIWRYVWHKASFDMLDNLYDYAILNISLTTDYKLSKNNEKNKFQKKITKILNHIQSIIMDRKKAEAFSKKKSRKKYTFTGGVIVIITIICSTGASLANTFKESGNTYNTNVTNIQINQNVPEKQSESSTNK